VRDRVMPCGGAQASSGPHRPGAATLVCAGGADRLARVQADAMEGAHMSPVTHALVGWILANSIPLSRRERALVMGAGVVPDLDGLGLLVDRSIR
jgi:hypothetical protein